MASDTGQFVYIKGVDRLAAEMRQLQRAYRDLPKKIARKYVAKAVREATKGFRSEVRAVTPKGKTGNLRKGISTQVKYKTSGKGFFSYRVGFDRRKAPHALLLEEGTKNRRAKSTAAYRGRVQATRFFKKLADRRAPAISRAMAEKLRTYLEEAARQSMPNAI